MKKFKYRRSYYRVFSVFIALVMIVVSVPVISLDTAAADEDFSGIWLFNNVKYDKKYIHINNNNSMTDEGEIIELHEYNKYWALRWYIISVGNGYYKIESVFSDKVLTAPTGYNNDIVTQTTYTGANTQQWKFIAQSDGTYKISPKSNANCFLTAGDLSDVADQDLEIRSNQSDNSDEWYLFKKVITYTNYHDSIFHSSLIADIPLANVFSQVMFAKYFNVGLNTTGTSSLYPTIIDDCPRGVALPCNNSSCGSSCESHHKNIVNISDQIYYGARESDHIYVLWTDRLHGTYCLDEQNIYGALAVVYNHRPVIHFMNLAVGSSSVQEIFMAITLMHETAHVFGMGEAYNNSGHDIVNGTRCVMEQFDVQTASAFYYDVVDGQLAPFCNSCIVVMQSYTSNINISGN